MTDADRTVQVSSIGPVEPGARIFTDYMSRKSRTYLIYEAELQSLTVLDAVIGVCATILVFSLSMIGSALWDLGYTPPDAVSPRGEFGWGWVVFWAVFGLAVTAIGVGALYWRHLFVSRIKRESFRQ